MLQLMYFLRNCLEKQKKRKRKEIRIIETEKTQCHLHLKRKQNTVADYKGSKHEYWSSFL